MEHTTCFPSQSASFKPHKDANGTGNNLLQTTRGLMNPKRGYKYDEMIKILTAVTMKITILHDVTPCSPVRVHQQKF
jgi:hypothetical protein